MKQKRPETNYIECPVCGVRNDYTIILHTGNEPYAAACNICGYYGPLAATKKQAVEVFGAMRAKLNADLKRLNEKLSSEIGKDELP